MKKSAFTLLLLCFIFFKPAYSQDKAIAITIDDLPFVGEQKNFHLNLIIDCLEKTHVPATGFIIGDRVSPPNWTVLKRFRDSGNALGNHTFSHQSLNQLSAAQYIDEIEHTDMLLRDVLTQPKYFRYPYLAMGQGAKKQQVLDYLRSKDYRIAPITIDSRDFVFNQQLLDVPEINRREFLTQLRPVYLDYILLKTLEAEQINRSQHHENRPQILLIHANLLNAYVLYDIIALYQNLGYRFVSLEEALKNPTNPEKFSKATPTSDYKFI